MVRGRVVGANPLSSFIPRQWNAQKNNLKVALLKRICISLAVRHSLAVCFSSCIHTCIHTGMLLLAYQHSY